MKLSQVGASSGNPNRPAPAPRVRDHARRAGATNLDEGLVDGRPIGAARSGRDRVIAGVLFTCSQSDSDRDRDVSARGERGRYVMASQRASSSSVTRDNLRSPSPSPPCVAYPSSGLRPGPSFSFFPSFQRPHLSSSSAINSFLSFFSFRSRFFLHLHTQVCSISLFVSRFM